MRWKELRKGDVVLCVNRRVWAILASSPSEGKPHPHRLPTEVVRLRWVDLLTGRVREATQDGSRDVGGEVLRRA